MLGILYSGTKIEANSRNSVPDHSVEEKKARIGNVPAPKIQLEQKKKLGKKTHRKCKVRGVNGRVGFTVQIRATRQSLI
jgi:hypothetical protein